jgi:spore coat polysaccharide biosynthesis protein SpsF
VEINQSAVEELRKLDDIDVYPTSLLEFQPSRQWDLVLIKGVLIHVNPNELDLVYGLLYASSRRYICIAEYYNPTPVGITYRGHQNRLFKRDFAGEMLDRYQDLAIVDYGFAYHRDRSWPQDDITWFLLQRT